jgi:hypothetical protein
MNRPFPLQEESAFTEDEKTVKNMVKPRADKIAFIFLTLLLIQRYACSVS